VPEATVQLSPRASMEGQRTSKEGPVPSQPRRPDGIAAIVRPHGLFCPVCPALPATVRLLSAVLLSPAG
jgi:hypothetical protein